MIKTKLGRYYNPNLIAAIIPIYGNNNEVSSQVHFNNTWYNEEETPDELDQMIFQFHYEQSKSNPLT